MGYSSRIVLEWSSSKMMLARFVCYIKWKFQFNCNVFFPNSSPLAWVFPRNFSCKVSILTPFSFSSKSLVVMLTEKLFVIVTGCFLFEIRFLEITFSLTLIWVGFLRVRFSTKTLLTLRMSAFFAKKQHFLAKIVPLLKSIVWAVLEVCLVLFSVFVR